MVEISWIIILIQLQWKLTTFTGNHPNNPLRKRHVPLKHDFLIKGWFFSTDVKGTQFHPPILQRTWSQSFLSSAATTSLRMSSRQAAACPNFTKAGPKAWKSGSRVVGCNWFLFEGRVGMLAHLQVVGDKQRFKCRYNRWRIETHFMGKLNCYKILQVHKGTIKNWLLHTYCPHSSKKVGKTLRRCLITNEYKLTLVAYYVQTAYKVIRRPLVAVRGSAPR